MRRIAEITIVTWTCSCMFAAPPLFSRRKYWAARFGVAPFLPMSRAEMDALAGIPATSSSSPAMPTSIIPASAWRSLAACWKRKGSGSASSPSRTGLRRNRSKALGQPNLFFGITAGNMDSMVNRYTSDRRLRHNDAYTPNDEGGKRPDRAVIVYSQRCREAYPDAPIIIGGIEASSAPHRPLRLLVGQGAALDPAGRQGRPAAVRQRRTRHRRSRPPHRRWRASPKAMRDVRGTAFISPRLAGRLAGNRFDRTGSARPGGRASRSVCGDAQYTLVP
jgi:hypothetical protein